MIALTRERESAGLTRTELGARAHMHPARVGQIENGRVVPPAGSVELARLAAALHFAGDPADLLNPADDTQDPPAA